MARIPIHRAGAVNGLASLIFLAIAFLYGLDRGFHRVIPDPVESHNLMIAAALSDLGHGSHLGGAANAKVYEALRRGGMSVLPEYLDPLGIKFPDNIFDPDLMNRAMEGALANPDAEPTGQRVKTDIVLGVPYDLGQYLYFKLAFALFGIDVASFYFLYFAILGASVLAFAAGHWRDPLAMLTLTAVTGAHALMLPYIVAVGEVQGVYHLAAPHNNRFLSALAVVPTLHLAWTFVRRPDLDARSGTAAAVQTAILMFAALVRVNASWGIVFLAAIALWRLLRLGWTAARAGGRANETLIIRVRTALSWPAAILLAGFLGQQAIERFAFHPLYSLLDETMPRHLVWHGTYQGLRLHPTWDARFAEAHMQNGALPGPDEVPVAAVERWLEKYGIAPDYMRSPIDGRLKYRTYERVLAQVYADFAVDNPRFMLELTLIHKPRLFVEIYAQTMEPTVGSVPIWAAAGGLLLLALSGWSAGAALGAAQPGDARRGLTIIGAMYGVAMIPLMIAAPGGYACGDQIWLINTFVLLAFALGCTALLLRAGRARQAGT